MYASVVLCENINGCPKIFPQLRTLRDWIWENCLDKSHKATSHYTCKSVWCENVDWVEGLPGSFGGFLAYFAHLEIIAYDQDLSHHPVCVSKDGDQRDGK